MFQSHSKNLEIELLVKLSENIKNVNDMISVIKSALDHPQGEKTLKQALIFFKVPGTAQTILHYACKINSLDLIHLLFQKKLLPKGFNYRKDTQGNTPAHFALLSGNDELIDYLLAQGITFSQEPLAKEELLKACYTCNIVRIEKLLEWGVQVNVEHFKTVLLSKVSNEMPEYALKTDIIKALIQHSTPGELWPHYDYLLLMATNTDSKNLTLIHLLQEGRHNEELLHLTKNLKTYKTAFQPAIDLQKTGNYNTILVMANFLFDKVMEEEPLVDPQDVFELYQAIVKDSPHFVFANEQLLNLICTQSPSKEDSINLLEEKFRYALLSNNEKLTDQFFHELCGEADLTPDIKQIKGDPDTLIALAKKIRNLNAFKKQHEEKPEPNDSLSTTNTTQMKKNCRF